MTSVQLSGLWLILFEKDEPRFNQRRKAAANMIHMWMNMESTVVTGIPDL